MMNSFALQNIVNLTQGPGTASHPGRTLDGPGFLTFLAIEQLAAEQASIPSETFLPDSDGDILKALGNGQNIDPNKAAIAPVEKGAELAHNKKATYSILDTGCSILDRRIQNPASSIKHRASSLSSPVPGLLSQVLYLMSCAYPPANKVFKGDIMLSQATEDAHRLDVSLMNAGADIRALRHTSYVMRHRYGVSQPSVVHIASQPETIERVVQTSPPDQPFLRVKPTTDYGSSHVMRQTSYVMRHSQDVSQSIASQPETIERVVQASPPDQPFLRVKPTTDHGSSHVMRQASYVMRHRHDVSQPSVVHIASQPETIERVVQAFLSDQPFLRVKPTTDPGAPITDYGSRTHDVVYANAREALPGSFVSRPGVIPDDITESPHIVVLSKGPAEKQVFYANPKSDTPDSWVKAAGNIAERNPGDVIASVKHDPVYTEENSEVSVQAKGTPEVYRQPETEHTPRIDASHVKPSVQIQRVIYVPDGNGELEQREIGEMGERPVSSNDTYSRSGSPADEVANTPVREDSYGNSEPQLRIEAHQIGARIDERQIFQHVFREQGSPKPSLQDNDVRFNTVPSNTFEGASVAEKVQVSQQQEIKSQTPGEYVRIEGNVQKIQPELVAEGKVDRIHQPLRQEITSQNVQEYEKHPQINGEVRSEMRYGAASLDAFEGASVAGKVQKSPQQEIMPQTSREYVRIEGNIQEIQPEPVGEEKADRIHQPLPQEISPQNVQEYGKHIEDDAKIEMRYGSSPLNTFEGVSVAEKVQKSQPQEVILQAVKEIQPEPVGEEKADRLHQLLRQEIRPQDAQEYGKHLELNDEIKIETRRGVASPDVFEVGSVAGKVQKSQPQEVILQAVKETGRIQQLVQQAVGSQNVRDYVKNPEFRVESQAYGKEVRATASMPELHVEGTSTLQDKIPFYVSKMVAGERSEAIWIQLEPEHLGKVRLRVLLSDSKISVDLSVNRPETRGIIELQVPDIRRSLAQHEIEIAEFRVSLENGFSNSNPRDSNLLHDNADTDSRPAHEQGDWNGNKGEHSTRQRYYRSDSLVDLLA